MHIGPLELKINKNRSELQPEEPTEREQAVSSGESGSAGKGSTWSSFFDQDYNPVLRGQRGLKVYDRMRRGDPKVRGLLRLLKTPLLAAEWYVEPASPDDLDVYVAKFVEHCINHTSRQFLQVIQEALLFLDFGFYIFEKVYELDTWDDRTVAVWKKFGPRHPLSIEDFERDENGGVQRVIHNREYPFGYDKVTLNIDELLIFTLDEESNDPQGMSILRSAYEPWYFKQQLYKIDAIQKERHGIGIPKIKLPPNPTPEDRNLARELGRNLRTNEKSYVVEPHNMEVSFIELSGNPVDVLASAVHHDHQMAKNMLATFLDIGTSESGARATSDTQSENFIKSIKYLGDLVCGIFNMWAIPELVGYNFTVKDHPKLRVRRLGEEADFRALSVALRNLKESGIITPDPGTEEFMRDWMDLPKMSQEASDRGMDKRLETVVNAGQNDNSAREDKPADGG